MMEERHMPFFLMTDLVNIFYATGFRGSAGVVLLSLEEAFLWVDPRYTLQAHEQAQEVQIIEARRGLLKAAAAEIRRKRAREVGYENSRLSCAQFEELQQETRSKVAFIKAAGLVEGFRAVKEAEEVERVRVSGRVTAQVFEELLSYVRPGASESDLAAEIEYRMRKKGAEGAAFETIVASGSRGALPHARASGKRLENGELVIFDLGAILAGYCADMTRTIYLGKPGRRIRNLFDAVAEAQKSTVAAMRPGIRTADVDATARRALRKHGLDRFFTHSTGHGVGLEIHEMPRLGRGDKTRLQVGNVVTAEPGIYLPGLGGIRIEDTVVVGPQNADILTPASKNDWVID
jgi:Xaa-Pro aminopeptidase